MSRDKWVSAKTVQETFEISEKWLEKQRQEVWKYGKEFLDISSGARPTYRYNLPLITSILKTHPAQRR